MVPHSTEKTMSRGASTDRDDALPIDHAVAAGAADRRAGDLAALGVGLLDGNILGMQMDQPAQDAFEPPVRVLAGQESCCRYRS